MKSHSVIEAHKPNIPKVMKVYVYVGIYLRMQKPNDIRVFSKKDDAEKFILDNVNPVFEKFLNEHYTSADIDEAISNWCGMFEDGRSDNPDDEYYSDIVTPLADDIILVECEFE